MALGKGRRVGKRTASIFQSCALAVSSRDTALTAVLNPKTSDEVSWFYSFSTSSALGSRQDPLPSSASDDFAQGASSSPVERCTALVPMSSKTPRDRGLGSSIESIEDFYYYYHFPMKITTRRTQRPPQHLPQTLLRLHQ
jgi:hypothetical protein